METKGLCYFLSFATLAGTVSADPAALRAAIRERSDGALLEESVAWAQSAVEAGLSLGYGAELRPSLSDSDAGLALRIYLPNRWSKATLREQLQLATQAEQLRIAALEWKELLTVYRNFCSYRTLDRQRDLYAAELSVLEPYLARADASVKQHQLAIVDRAKLYGRYLDLLNDREKMEMEKGAVAHQLRLMLGNSADLEIGAKTAVITSPVRQEIDELLQLAMSRRADYRKLSTEARSLTVSEKAARSEDGFHFKYIQPEYSMDTDGGGNQWGVSAAFVLPWGNRNKDAAVYAQKRELTLSTMTLQRQRMAERLQVLLRTSDACAEQIDRRNRLMEPLRDQLKDDLKQLNDGPLQQLFDRLAIRERILDTALQSTKAEYQRERIAVDLAEELGTLGE